MSVIKIAFLGVIVSVMASFLSFSFQGYPELPRQVRPVCVPVCWRKDTVLSAS